MQEGNMLDALREKEREMEALINEARLRGLDIRRDSERRARELMESRLREIEAEEDIIRSREEEIIAHEAARIEDEASSMAVQLKEKAEGRKGEAARAVLEFIAGVAFDKGDV